MNRDRDSLFDMVNAAQQALQFATGLDRAALAVNLEKQSAILYQVIVLGEATKRLSVEFRNQHPEVPWRDIAGMRDVLAHQYDRVDLIKSAIKESACCAALRAAQHAPSWFLCTIFSCRSNNTLWDVIQTEIPELLTILEPLLKNL
jgi:uncharacterized protein with HEPN domain